MRVASRVLQFAIPVLVVTGLGADVVVISIISMVKGIDILVVGNVVMVNDGKVGSIVHVQ